MITVPVMEDDIVEGTETFQLRIQAPSDDDDFRLRDSDQITAIGYIIDSTS